MGDQFLFDRAQVGSAAAVKFRYGSTILRSKHKCRDQRQAMASVQREIGAGGNAPHDDPENALGEIRVLQLVAN